MQNKEPNYGNSAPKHQKQINPVEPTKETQPDPPGFDNTLSSELKLNRIYFETTDDASNRKYAFNQHASN